MERKGWKKPLKCSNPAIPRCCTRRGDPDVLKNRATTPLPSPRNILGSFIPRTSSKKTHKTTGIVRRGRGGGVAVTRSCSRMELFVLGPRPGTAAKIPRSTPSFPAAFCRRSWLHISHYSRNSDAKRAGQAEWQRFSCWISSPSSSSAFIPIPLADPR